MRTSALAKVSHTSVTPFLVFSFLALLAPVSPGFSSQSPAPVPSATTATVKGRYLVVVETSKGMERRAVGALEGVRELLFTGMRGQLREGDTIGIWTFSDQLQTGKFPLQQWSPRNSRQIGERALNFLQSQRFEKEGGLQTALEAMHRVISSSEFMTIALVTTGNEYISGTPFDSAINQTYKNWQSGQQKKQMPMMTVLRGRKGQYTDFAVTPLPFPIDIPPFPADLVVQAPKPAETNRPAPAPLIVTGPKRQPPEAGPAPLIITGPKRQPAEPVEPKLLPATSSASNLVVAPADSPQSAAATLAQQPPTTTAVLPATPAPAALQETSSAQPGKPSSTAENNPAPAIPASAQNPIAAQPSEVPSRVPAPETASSSTGSLQAQLPANSAPTVTNPVGSPQTAVATPALPVQSHGVARVAALGAAGLALAALLLWLFLRRSPPAQRSSLITRSLEREQK